jgi:Family of unknown function (DUF6029)
MRKIIIVLTLIIAGYMSSYSQLFNKGQIHGNFYVKSQTYNPDSVIGADTVPEKSRMNAYGNITYTNGEFSAGLRYEAYYNALLGYDPAFQGSGIPYKFVQYNGNDFDITLGNFYDQFGMGLILRTFEDQSLGYDNSMEGVRIKFNPFEGVYLKGIYGKQRYVFSLGDGIVRGLDGEVFLNQTFKKLADSKTIISIGGGFVSKYQEDNDPSLILPENVSAFSGRLNIMRGKISLNSEYAYKINDPSKDNRQIYKEGQALNINATYSQRGFSVLLGAKRIDNMSFRSERNASLNNLNINYIPTTTKNHTYSLASMYPYATQPNGEVEIQGEVQYKIKKGTKIGGKYGTFITLNYSIVKSIDKQPVIIDGTSFMDIPGTNGYSSDFFTLGDEVYFQDLNIEIKRKINKKLKGTLNYLNIVYNKDVVEGVGGYGKIYADIIIADVTYKLAKKQAIRVEAQHLSTKEDHGNWASALIEYTFAPKWFITLYDDFNYGHEDKIHYPTIAFAFNKNASRLEMAYGRQREGVICVGGICRLVPASNGFSITFSTSF